MFQPTDVTTDVSSTPDKQSSPLELNIDNTQPLNSLFK